MFQPWANMEVWWHSVDTHKTFFFPIVLIFFASWDKWREKMQIKSEVVEKWLIPKNEKEEFEQYFTVVGEEDKTTNNGDKYSILKLTCADGDFKVSSWALTTEKGIVVSTEKGMKVKLWKKKGNNYRFFINNIEVVVQ
jgi:hypothetical protein